MITESFTDALEEEGRLTYMQEDDRHADIYNKTTRLKKTSLIKYVHLEAGDI